MSEQLVEIEVTPPPTLEEIDRIIRRNERILQKWPNTAPFSRTVMIEQMAMIHLRELIEAAAREQTGDDSSNGGGDATAGASG